MIALPILDPGYRKGGWSAPASAALPRERHLVSGTMKSHSLIYSYIGIILFQVPRSRTDNVRGWRVEHSDAPPFSSSATTWRRRLYCLWGRRRSGRYCRRRCAVVVGGTECTTSTVETILQAVTLRNPPEDYAYRWRNVIFISITFILVFILTHLYSSDITEPTWSCDKPVY